MCKVVAFVQLFARSLERRIIEEGPQQFIVTRSRLVRAGEYCVNYTQITEWSNALCRNSVSRLHSTVTGGRVLERAHNGRSYSNDVTALLFRALNCERGYFRNPIWFVQGK